MEIAKVEGNRESKNRPVATNFQFLKISCPLGQLLVGACLPQTLRETNATNWKLLIYILYHGVLQIMLETLIFISFQHSR